MKIEKEDVLWLPASNQLTSSSRSPRDQKPTSFGSKRSRTSFLGFSYILFLVVISSPFHSCPVYFGSLLVPSHRTQSPGHAQRHKILGHHPLERSTAGTGVIRPRQDWSVEVKVDCPRVADNIALMARFKDLGGSFEYVSESLT
jgi:hypothetical protein